MPDAPDTSLAGRLALPSRAAALPAAPLVLPRVALRPLPPATRIALRCRAAALAPFSAAFGVAIPGEAMLRAAASGPRAALRLGPDEWLLRAEDCAAESLLAAFAPLAAGGVASVVDVSHRQVALAVDGPGAAEVINEACPLDLSAEAFPPGMCSRTVFGRSEILLWRPEGGEGFVVEVWRSFAGYLWTLLAEAAGDLDPG